MKRFWLLFVVVGATLALFWGTRTPVPIGSLSPTPVSPSAPPARLAVVQSLHYRVYTLDSAEVHTLLIPHDAYDVTVARTAGVDTLSNFAARSSAIAVLNGGFFDPENQQSTSYIVEQGRQVDDPHHNDRLMHNPELAPYLNKIFNRSELRRYQCQQQTQYAVAQHQQPVPEHCQLTDALGAGPQLLPALTLEQEGFLQRDGETILRDSLDYQHAHPRSAVGLMPNGDLLWVMVAQRSSGGGLSLPALTDFLTELNVHTAINFDGGSSSALYYNGRTIYGTIDNQGQAAERPVHSVLIVRRHSSIQ